MRVKRFISMIMCVFLLLTQLPAVILAAGSVDVDTAEEFANAVGDAAIDTINITGSFSLESLASAVFINRQVTVTSGGTFEIDVTGRPIVIDSSGDVTISGNLCFTGSGTNGKTITVNGGRLTATDGVEIMTTGDNGAAALEVMASGIVNMTGNITANGRHSHGIISSESSNVTVTGNVYASGDLVSAIVVEFQSIVEVTGDVTATDNGSENSGIEYGIEVRNGSQATINGDVTAIGPESCGIFLRDGSLATINGSVSVEGDYSCAVYAEGYSAAVTSAAVTGNVSADGEGSTGVFAFMGAAVNIGGSVSVQGYNSEAVYAMTSTEGDPPATSTVITVGGDVSIVGDEGCAVSAADRAGTGATVTVDGNVTASGLESYGLDVWGGGVATINGNVTAAGLDSRAASVDGAGSNAEVTGDITASGGQNYGIEAGYDGVVTIYGDVTVEGFDSCAVYAVVDGIATVTGNVSADGDTSCAVYADEGGTAHITGNVSAAGDLSCALRAEDTDSAIEIIGNVTAAADYIILNDVPKAAGDGTAGTGVYELYLLYDDGTSAVRIKNPVTYTVTFSSNGSTYNTKTVSEGESIGSANWPSNPTRSGYTFGGWFTETNGSGTQFTSSTAVNSNITVYAEWTPNDSGGSSSGSYTPSAPVYRAVVKAEGAVTTLPVTVNKDAGSASIDIGSRKFAQGGTVITIPSIPGVGTYSVGIPVQELQASDRQGMLTITTDQGSVAILSNMLTGISGITGNKAEIRIGQGDKESLPEDVKAAIGDRPLIQLALAIDGKQTDWSNPSAPVTVSIPYTPTAAELLNPDSIVIWYIDGRGNAVSISNSRYDQDTGTVTFFTTHFSHYAVTYVHQTFSDLGDVEWARKAIEAIASKGISNGTGTDTFSPGANITRADYMVLLINTLGLTAGCSDNFDDVEPGVYYYEAVGIAKKLGIAAGSGNNRFNPADFISRQDMIVLAARALEKYKGLKTANDNTILEKFNNMGDISEYAVNSLNTMVSVGLITGYDHTLNPRSSTTRAEAAVFLYNIYKKYPGVPAIAAASDL